MYASFLYISFPFVFFLSLAHSFFFQVMDSMDVVSFLGTHFYLYFHLLVLLVCGAICFFSLLIDYDPPTRRVNESK